jgi:uncharacterized protein
MSSPAVLKFDASDVAPEVSFVAGDKLLAGNPQQTLWVHCTDVEGRATTVTAGESFVMPRGFTGTWEVVETTTKRFVIYEAGP